MRRILLLLGVLLLVAGCARMARDTAPGGIVPDVATRTGVPAFSHVFIIVFENLGYSEATRLPYIASLGARYGIASDYYSVAHPSLPNYLALASGGTWATGDCNTCYVNADNLAAEAAQAHVSWGSFQEGLPSACYLGASSSAGGYSGKHDPFRYFLDVRDNPSQCARLQPLTALQRDLAGSGATVPRLVWITPNSCHDMDACPPQSGDAWLRGFVPQILASPDWKQGGVLFVTWDENNKSDTDGCCNADPGGGRVLTLVVAPGVAAGTKVNTPYNHYSLLATVEDGLGLPLLGNAANAAPMSAFWSAPGA